MLAKSTRFAMFNPAVFAHSVSKIVVLNFGNNYAKS